MIFVRGSRELNYKYNKLIDLIDLRRLGISGAFFGVSVKANTNTKSFKFFIYIK